MKTINLYSLKMTDGALYKAELKRIINQNNRLLKRLNENKEITNVSLELLETESILNFRFKDKVQKLKIQLKDYEDLENTVEKYMESL
ncbi:hypothetical protein [Vagococcus fluvialis]|uniref:hypothetical protein n=1 Tax=Vagococcus fluvialis TaxID=2738 RepID=UPI001D09EC36|nr:hypothetical protein [Vagococcus fluvialis]UDM84066.1 hypothetical protein K5K96_15245 [Vagococcus fluvialis]